jgi:AraC family transcriptional regulator, regulatory protein of adaptative response / methylated-DNA-[protein]-cysteine methyltransferase
MMQIEAMKSSQPAPESAHWQAVVTRDRNFDGQLLYAVRSTGVYCRPSCPSRRPKRQNVEFYFGADAAERAGYRACRRCKPTNLNFGSAEGELARRVCQHISQNLEGTLSLEVLSAQLQVSPFHLQRTFKKVMGISPRQYAEARRLAVLKGALRFGVPVTEAIYQAGYGSSSRVYERSDERLGMTPQTYRKGGEGMLIRYVIAESALGKLLVAGTERGISAVCLGDSEAKLKRALFGEYPKAKFEADSSRLRPWVQAILQELRGELPSVELPLDLQATAFQWRVWEELRRIPRGSTRSYTEVARAIGKPRAVRAVARACATNPACLVIPCHRVVREDGEMGGYRWGIKRKERLLEREKSAAGRGDL